VDQVLRPYHFPIGKALSRKTAVRGLARESTTSCVRPIRARKSSSGSFGWPSAGQQFLSGAVPGPFKPGRACWRDFVAGGRRARHRLQYCRGRSINRKKTFRRQCRPLLGFPLDASFAGPKFAWTGPLVDADYWKAALLAVLVGSFLSISISGRSRERPLARQRCLPAPTI